VGPDSSNCNRLYSVCEIGLVGFIMATAYGYLILMPASMLIASVNLVNSNHIGSYCMSLGYDTVIHVTVNIDVNHRLIN